MTYRIVGLRTAPFTHYFSMNDRELIDSGARRLIADSDSGYPCRVSLRDAEAGERVLLVNFVSHEVANPYRTAHAIYIREGASEAEPFVDRLPPVFEGRTMSLRGFDRDGMMVHALLAAPGTVEAGISSLFSDPEVACIHAHNAAHGCFAARIEREGDGL
ncbi:uncharacterized protein DUF1203 [Novosphingobium sp. PhB165]|uniref:DUF1203 domain-containing protein n=1 Tax=Novosphingobium sp. PhB165 TaxID=2485105 RepID=UPI001044E14B|nr:DUF1203 domain-containing protein [Novosphingobium sp. PhB165]TCM21909.1 uncharacterized protein DUF1203 [Novosphingobium sp. PhB165]